MKLNRKVVSVKKLSEGNESFSGAPPAELVSFIWELTKEIWSLRGSKYVKQRLQRNVTKLIRQ